MNGFIIIVSIRVVKKLFLTVVSCSGADLFSKVEFDREEKKSYLIPVAISDSGVPQMTGTSTLTLVIGDENDNEMKSGSSSIFVYNYKVNPS